MTDLDLFNYHQTTSQRLNSFSKQLQTSDVSIAKLIESLPQQSFAGIFFILALLCFIPGVSIIAGVVLIFPSVQIILGQSSLALPNKIAQKNITSQRLLKGFQWLLPRLRFLEKRIKLRWQMLSSPTAYRVLGVVVLINAIIVAIPFPLSNILPAISLVFLSLGMLEKDGLFVVLGVLISAISVVVSWTVVNSLFHYLKPLFF